LLKTRVGTAIQLSIIGAAALLSACAANRTTIRSSWTDAEYTGPPLDRIAVVALFDTRADSLAFERNAAEYLESLKIATVPAHELLTPAETLTLDEEQIRERLAPTDVDGILIFRLVAIDERREYQVPAPYPPNAAESGSGHAFAWYYQAISSDPTVSSPSAVSSGSQGYWIEQDFLVAETALFDNRDNRLLWTAKSETLDDARLRRTSESIVRTVARQLIAMDLVARMAAASPPAPTPDQDERSRGPRSTGRNRA
jgi:hypothetical protein